MKTDKNMLCICVLLTTLSSLPNIALAQSGAGAATLSAEKPAIEGSAITAEQCKMGFAEIQKQYQSLDEQCSKIQYMPEIDSTLLHSDTNPALPE